MKDLIENKKIVIFCIFIFIVAFILIISTNNTSKSNGESISDNRDIEITHYDANQYIPVYIDEEDIINKYLNEFKNLVVYDVNEAYNVLNSKYRNLKFGNIDNFKSYVNNLMGLTFYNIKIDKYIVKNIDGYKYFDISATDGNRYIFKEISIMNYEVYLDNYTVDIG